MAPSLRQKLAIFRRVMTLILMRGLANHNGSEFLENHCRSRGCPPSCAPWDLIAVTFGSPADCWAKVTTYWQCFNLMHPNRGKEWQALQILRCHAPDLVGVVLNQRLLNPAQRHHF